jgi:hypothetical protein
MKHIKLFENFEVLNEALNKELKSFSSDLKKKLTDMGFKVDLALDRNVHDEINKVKNSAPGIS